MDGSHCAPSPRKGHTLISVTARSGPAVAKVPYGRSGWDHGHTQLPLLETLLLPHSLPLSTLPEAAESSISTLWPIACTPSSRRLLSESSLRFRWSRNSAEKRV